MNRNYLKIRISIAIYLLGVLAPGTFAGSLLNTSYNGPVDATDVRLGFIVEKSATFALTAESVPGSGGQGVPDPTLELINVIDGTIIFFNDDCDIDIAAVLNRPLTTELDACAVLQLAPGPYAIAARDANGISGNILVGLSELPVANAQLLSQTTLAWDASISVNVGGYRLYYGKASAAYTSEVNVGNRTSYKVTGLQPNRSYFFAVTAYSSFDSALESGFSNEVSAYISPPHL